MLSVVPYPIDAVELPRCPRLLKLPVPHVFMILPMYVRFTDHSFLFSRMTSRVQDLILLRNFVLLTCG
jgi:hypothetical protein